MSESESTRERGLYEGLVVADSVPVSRADFDALKRRVEQLEKLVGQEQQQ